MYSWLKNIGLSLLTISIISIIPAYGEKITLTAFDYPPYMDESLGKKGLFCELVSEAYKSVGYDVSFKFLPLMRSTHYVMKGEELAQLGTKWNFPKETNTSTIESVPLFYYRVVGFYLKDRFKSISFKTLNDLKAFRLGVIRGSSDAAILQGNPNLNLEEVSFMKQMFNKVYTNRNDIGFTVELSGLTFISKFYPKEKNRWVMSEDAIQGILADVVFSKKYPNAKTYINAFKKGVQKIRKNGTYHKVFEKYYGIGKVPSVVSDINKKPYIIPNK